MPIHDWTLVEAGLFHDFHHAWIEEIKRALNGGVLPEGFFALAEQTIRGPIPDVLTLKASPNGHVGDEDEGGVAVATAPPGTRFTLQAERNIYAVKANRITVRHRHRRGQIIAIVSPGNKSSVNGLRWFVEKSEQFLRQGIHLLVVDLFPPSKRDPGGIHKAIWDTFEDVPYEPPRGKDRTLAAYSACDPVTAYVEPLGVGDKLAEMPLFLTPDRYVPTPLEATYQAAWAVFPAALKPELEPKRRRRSERRVRGAASSKMKQQLR